MSLTCGGPYPGQFKIHSFFLFANSWGSDYMVRGVLAMNDAGMIPGFSCYLPQLVRRFLLPNGKVMPSLNISLPAPLREWIEAQVKGGRYGNASEYLRELIRRDQDRQAQERLESLLLEGVKSGTASPLTQKDWSELRTEVAERLEKRWGTRGKKSR